jgi:TonB family protein
MVIHTVVLAVAGGMTLFRMTGTTYAPSYTVDLVSLPAAPKASRPGKAAAPVPKAEPKPAPKPAPRPPEPAAKPVKKPAAPPPAEKTATIKPSGGDEAAAARLERQRRIEELEQQARKLYESFTADGAPEIPAGPDVKGGAEVEESVSTGPTASSGTGSPAGGGNPADIRFKAYYNRIWSKIRSSWVPQGVAPGEKLKAVVEIRIAPDGRIKEYRVEEGSGNDYYDQSAIRAVRKSSPLPALPEELGDKPLEVGLNFNYPE